MLLAKKNIFATVATVFLAACTNNVSEPKTQRIEISTDAPKAGAICLLQDSKGNRYRVDPTPGDVSIMRHGGPVTITCRLEGYKETSYVITEQARGGSSNFMGLAGGGDTSTGTMGLWYPTVNIIKMVPGKSTETYSQQHMRDYLPSIRSQAMSEDDAPMMANKQMVTSQMPQSQIPQKATLSATLRPDPNVQKPLVGSLAPAPTQHQIQKRAADHKALHQGQQNPQIQPKRRQPSPQPVNVTGGFTIQAGAFANQSNAQKMVTKLQTQGFGVVVKPIQRQNRTLYAVHVGFFKKSAAAKAALQTFQQRTGTKGFVIARK